MSSDYRYAVVNVAHRPEADCPSYDAGFPCPDERHFTYAISGDRLDADGLAARLRHIAEITPERDDPGRSSVHISVRCDAAAPFGFVKNTLRSCAAAGISKIEVAAAWPERR